MNFGKHELMVCPQCGPAIRCGVCGNACCNGGSGKTTGKHGSCDCEEAYQLQEFCGEFAEKLEDIAISDLRRTNKRLCEAINEMEESILKSRAWNEL
jgi:hypothetical protein